MSTNNNDRNTREPSSSVSTEIQRKSGERKSGERKSGEQKSGEQRDRRNTASRDDYDGIPLEQLASNNPAMTLPAWMHLTGVTSSTTEEDDSSPATPKQSRARSFSLSRPIRRHQSFKVSDPAADEGFVVRRQTTKSTARSPGANQADVADDDDCFSAVSKHELGWRRVVRNFSPSWFSVTMGTGIVAILLFYINYIFPSRALYWLSIIFFVFNTFLFFLALGLTVVRYTLYPEIWAAMIADSTNSLFLGTMPMGFATLIDMWCFVCVPAWGDWAAQVAFALWVVDSVAAVAVSMSLTVLLMSRSHQQSLDRITAAQLLPIATTIVAAGAGSKVAQSLPLTQAQQALGTLIASYVMWGMSTPLAMGVLVIYYQRLALHKLPPREVIVSCFLPLGPLGMGGFAIMNLAKVSRTVFAKTDFLQAGELAGNVFYVLGVFVALIMWGFGVSWLVFALATIHQSRPFPFNMGWWGFTFPLGVFAVSTLTFGVEMSSLFFKVLGTIFSGAVILLWIVVAAVTAKGIVSGELFYAPCVSNLKPPENDASHDVAVPPMNG